MTDIVLTFQHITKTGVNEITSSYPAKHSAEAAIRRHKQEHERMIQRYGYTAEDCFVIWGEREDDDDLRLSEGAQDNVTEEHD